MVGINFTVVPYFGHFLQYFGSGIIEPLMGDIKLWLEVFFLTFIHIIVLLARAVSQHERIGFFLYIYSGRIYLQKLGEIHHSLILEMQSFRLESLIELIVLLFRRTVKHGKCMAGSNGYALFHQISGKLPTAGQVFVLVFGQVTLIVHIINVLFMRCRIDQ